MAVGRASGLDSHLGRDRTPPTMPIKRFQRAFLPRREAGSARGKAEVFSVERDLVVECAYHLC